MRERTVPRWRSGVALLLAAAALAACGDDDRAPDPDAATAHPDEVLLEVGKTVRLQIESPVAGIETPGVVDVTVTGIETGELSDLAGTDVDDVAGRVPTYVRYTMKAVSGRLDNAGLSGYVRAGGAAPGESEGLPLATSGALHGCEAKGFPATGVKPDQTVASCLTFLTAADAPAMDGIVFVSGGA